MVKCVIFGDFEAETETSSGWIFNCGALPFTPPSPELASELRWPATTNLNVSSSFFFVGFTEDASGQSDYATHCQTVAVHTRLPYNYGNAWLLTRSKTMHVL